MTPLQKYPILNLQENGESTFYYCRYIFSIHRTNKDTALLLDVGLSNPLTLTLSSDTSIRLSYPNANSLSEIANFNEIKRILTLSNVPFEIYNENFDDEEGLAVEISPNEVSSPSTAPSSNQISSPPTAPPTAPSSSTQVTLQSTSEIEMDQSDDNMTGSYESDEDSALEIDSDYFIGSSEGEEDEDSNPLKDVFDEFDRLIDQQLSQNEKSDVVVATDTAPTEDATPTEDTAPTEDTVSTDSAPTTDTN